MRKMCLWVAVVAALFAGLQSEVWAIGGGGFERDGFSLRFYRNNWEGDRAYASAWVESSVHRIDSVDFDFRPDDWSDDGGEDEFLFSIDISGRLNEPANPEESFSYLGYKGTEINANLTYWDGGGENNPATNSASSNVIVPGATWAGGSVRTNYNDWQDEETGAGWFWWSVDFRGRMLNGTVVGGGGGGGGGKGIAPLFFSEAVVPEPTTLALLLAPAVGFFRRRWAA